MRRLREQFPNELVVIGVHSAKFPSEQLTANIREALMRHEMGHPVVNDAGFRIWQEYAVRAWPTLVLIDERGKVVRTQSGEVLAEELAPAITSLVALAEARGTLDRQPLRLRPELLDEPQRPLSYPSKLLMAPGGRLFVADTGHHRVVELLLADDGLSATVGRIFGVGTPALRDGPAAQAAFHSPRGMDLDGQTLYVADTDNHAVRAIDLDTGDVRTVAGTGAKAHGRFTLGAPTETPLRSPWDVVSLDGALLIAMAGSHQIWVLLAEEQIGPWAGAGFEALVDGPRDQAGFNQPSDLDVGAGHLFVADAEASAIRAVTLDDKSEVVTLVGQGLFEFGDVDGSGAEVRLQHPTGLAYYGGLVFVADSYNHKVKVLDPSKGEVITLIGTGEAGHGDGQFAAATLFEPEGLALERRAETLLIFVADTNNHLIRVGDLQAGELRTLRIVGLDRLSLAPAPADSDVVQLDPVVVGPGQVTISFDLLLPAGYKRNPDAPTTLREGANGPRHTFSAEQTPSLTLDITDDVDLALELTVYFCEATNEGLCLIHDRGLVLPLKVATDGPHEARVGYEVRRMPVTHQAQGKN